MAEPSAGGMTGLGFTYATPACAQLIAGVLAEAVIGHDAATSSVGPQGQAGRPAVGQGAADLRSLRPVLGACTPLAPSTNVRHLEYFADHARLDRILFDGVAAPTAGVLRPDLSRPGLGMDIERCDADGYRVAP